MEELQQQFSDDQISIETIQRFYTASGCKTKKCKKMLKKYLEWKKIYGNKATLGNDKQDWDRAIEDSYRYYCNDDNGDNGGNDKKQPPKFFQVLYDHDVIDNDGKRILQLIPERIDLSYPYEVYSTAMSSYIHTRLFHNDNSNTNEKVTILLDVRPGRGWPNPNIVKLMNVIRQICNHLTDIHPERIHKIIMFPMPDISVKLYWNVLKPILSKSITNNTILISNERCDRHAPAPKDKLIQYMNEETLIYLETFRRQLFIPPTP